MRLLSRYAAASTLLLLLPVVPSLADGGAATCRGLTVTIEGLSNTTITGTPGDDVILAPYGTSGRVDAGAGSDVVCVVPGPRIANAGDAGYTVDGGEGDDVIDGTALTPESLFLAVPMSAGSDAFYGGPELDLANVPSSTLESQQDTEVDVFVTGAGPDFVSSGTFGQPNPDRIDLGDGKDTARLAGTGQAAAGALTGGRGMDLLVVAVFRETEPEGGALPPGELVLDARTGTSSLAGTPYLRWDGMESYDLSSVHNRLTFVGTEEREDLTLSQGAVDARMGGGNDRVRHVYWAFPSGSVRGGHGRDRLRVRVEQVVSVDLDGQAVVRQDGRTRRLSLGSFEIATAFGRRVELRGGPSSDELIAVSRGKTRVFGRGGDDAITLFRSTYPRPTHELSAAYGGRGDDVLLGSGFADTLVGGPGRDRAEGRRGFDRCVAEVRRTCELP